MYENKAKRQLGTVIGVLAAIFMVVPSIFIDANAPRAKLDDRVVEKTVQTTDLLSLQLSKEQVESSSFEGRTGGSIIGNVGYAQGNSEGKPVIYIYTRYRAANMNDDAASAQDSFMDVTPQNPFYREIAWFKVQKARK